jgi:hypothetical protein
MEQKTSQVDSAKDGGSWKKSKIENYRSSVGKFHAIPEENEEH